MELSTEQQYYVPADKRSRMEDMASNLQLSGAPHNNNINGQFASQTWWRLSEARRSSISHFMDHGAPFKLDTAIDQGIFDVTPWAPIPSIAAEEVGTNNNSPACTGAAPFVSRRVTEDEAVMIQPTLSVQNALETAKSINDDLGQELEGIKKRKRDSSEVRFRSHQAENWMEKYEELLDYRLKNGDCLVPNQFPPNPSLAEWVKRQRYQVRRREGVTQKGAHLRVLCETKPWSLLTNMMLILLFLQYKLKCQGQHSSMSCDRVAALEKLGFVWNSHDAVWETRFVELKQYKGLFGDTNVPSNYEANPKLAIWIKRQRRQWKFLQEGKPSTMTPYRVDKLVSIDFSWSGRKPKKA
jgi:hypothetical protein